MDSMSTEQRIDDIASTGADIARRIAASNRDMAWDLNKALQALRDHQRHGAELDLDEVASVLFRANQVAAASEDRAALIAYNLSDLGRIRKAQRKRS